MVFRFRAPDKSNSNQQFSAPIVPSARHQTIIVSTRKIQLSSTRRNTTMNKHSKIVKPFKIPTSSLLCTFCLHSVCVFTAPAKVQHTRNNLYNRHSESSKFPTKRVLKNVLSCSPIFHYPRSSQLLTYYAFVKIPSTPLPTNTAHRKISMRKYSELYSRFQKSFF